MHRDIGDCLSHDNALRFDNLAERQKVPSVLNADIIFEFGITLTKIRGMLLITTTNQIV